MSRPKKRKSAAPGDMRLAVADGGELAASELGMAQALIDTLRVDPAREHPLACVLGSVILNRSTASDDELAGKLFVAALKASDPTVAARLFRQVIAMKEAAAQPHRNAFAFFAYVRYIEEAGREPSKPELRQYIEARRDVFRDAPGDEDKAGWARVWKASGLADLAPK